MKTNTIKYSTRYMHMCILANIKALHRISHLRLLAGAFIFCQLLGRDCVRSLRTLHSSAPAFCLPTCHKHRVIKDPSWVIYLVGLHPKHSLSLQAKSCLACTSCVLVGMLRTYYVFECDLPIGPTSVAHKVPYGFMWASRKPEWGGGSGTPGNFVMNSECRTGATHGAQK